MNKVMIHLLAGLVLLAPAVQAAPAASAPASAASTAATAISHNDVLKAVSILENNFLSEPATSAANVVMQFAAATNDVKVELNDKVAPWLLGKAANDTEEGYRYMLTAAYIAGNIKSQLSSKKPVDDPVSGWTLVIKSYDTLNERTKLTLPSVEKLKEEQAKGKLGALAKDALKH